MKKSLFLIFCLLAIHFHFVSNVSGRIPQAEEVVSIADKGYLELIEGQRVLHLKGTPYEIGYQHGSLLKIQIAKNIVRFVDKLSSGQAPAVVQNFMAALPQVIPHIPESLIQEMHGMADGSGISYDKILLLNLFPEMFHCSGITVSNGATLEGKLYHVRVLDYSAAVSLQNTAILAIVEPKDGNAFLNVTYAGFIGSVTGMNENKISVGEIGGKGYGSWNGLPMAFLLRQILEKTSSLEEIKSMLTNTPRTCEYYYVFADGKTKESLGVYATPDRLDFVLPGTAYRPISKNADEQPMRQQPNECIIFTRWDHYDLLTQRLLQNFGSITVNDLQEAIKRPVAHTSNLHNAIFAPESLDVWISHAGPHNEPACDQNYHHYNLLDLLHK